MKLFEILLVIFKLCETANSYVPSDNHLYVPGESKYVWIVDEGELELVNLEESPDSFLVEAHRSTPWVEFNLFSRSTGPDGIQLDFAAAGKNDHFKSDSPTIIFIHGWQGNASQSSADVKLLVNSYLYVTADNFIAVDWEKSAQASYTSAVRTVPFVANYIVDFITWLQKAYGEIQSLHLVGFGMGAHIAGIVGRQTGGLISRITGLDPLGPLFDSRYSSYALRPTDAVYVEGIHTTDAVLALSRPVGRADFYVNGGNHPQPRCTDLACSHFKAYQYFAATVAGYELYGNKCNSVSQAKRNRGCKGPKVSMGNPLTRKSADGIYHLRTKANWPYVT